MELAEFGVMAGLRMCFLAAFLALNLCHTVVSLECYVCTNLEVKSDNSVVQNLIGGRTNPGCKALDYGSVSSTTCSDGSVCGFIGAKVSVDIPFTSPVQVELQTRECLPVLQDTYSSDEHVCKEASDAEKDIANSVLGFLGEAGSVNIDSVKVCYCTTDLCDAFGCGSGEVAIAGYCATWWMMLLGVCGLILALFLLSCCCCCCCCRCCCKRNQPQAVYLAVSNQPGVSSVMVHTPAEAGIHAMQNPSYDYMHHSSDKALQEMA